MLKKGFLSILIMYFLAGVPVVTADDSASNIDAVVTWWEKYGKYWDDAVAGKDNDEAISVALKKTDKDKKQ